MSRFSTLIFEADAFRNGHLLRNSYTLVTILQKRLQRSDPAGHENSCPKAYFHLSLLGYAGPKLGDMARPILLAVDDDVSVLEAVVQDLRRQYGATYRVMRAASGQAALDTLDQLNARQEPVALLLSDQRMPGMTGVEFLERSRAIYPDARRVLLTAYADTEAAIRAINTARIHYYLNKPWDPPEEKLYPVLNDLLDDWKAGYLPPFEGLRVIGHRWSLKDHRYAAFFRATRCRIAGSILPATRMR